MPTTAVCEAHAALKRDTVKLLAFKRQLARMRQAVVKAPTTTSTTVKVEPSLEPLMVLEGEEEEEGLKRTFSSVADAGSPSASSNNKRPRVG
jgi:hypothetical protein